MKSRTLYQKTATGNVLKWTIYQDENILKYRWGFVGSARIQEQTEEVKEAHIPGHGSYKSPEQQASIIFERKVQDRYRNGYKDSYEEALESTVEDFSFDPFPSAFAPAKPIAIKPCLDKEDPILKDKPNKKIQQLINSGKLVAQKKGNGVRAFYVRRPSKNQNAEDMFSDETGNNNLLLSRKNKDMSEHFAPLKEHLDLLDIPDYTILDMEVTLGGGSTDKQFRAVSSMTPNTKPAEASQIYKKWNRENPEQPLVSLLFDIIFWSGENVYTQSYFRRYEICKEIQLSSLLTNSQESVIVPLNMDFDTAIIEMQKGKWEGLVLKDLDAGSEFWLNGKPKRPQGQWKWKNTKEEDCFVVDCIPEKGDESLVGALSLGQYDESGNVIDCGNAGSGLSDLNKTSAWDWINKVVTIKFDERMPRNDMGQLCFRNPRIVGLHPDKDTKECIYNESDDE